MRHSDDKIQQQIEAYLNQEMTDLERSKFEKQIHEDPDLHDEVEFQQSLIEAIRAERMAQLKAGLSQVNISLWSVALTEAFKTAAIVAGIGLMGTGVYFGYDYFNTKNDPVNSEMPAVAHEPTVEAQKSLPAAVEPVEKVPAQAVFESKEANSNQAENPAPLVSNSKVVHKENLKLASGKQIKGNTSANFDLAEEPRPGTLIGPQTRDIEIPTDGVSEKVVLESIYPEVVVKRDNKDRFHYQFADSRLVLYADFGDKLYEILELNQKGSRQLFFSYDGKFYHLNPNNTEISPLLKVSDPALIRVLSSYQTKRN